MLLVLAPILGVGSYLVAKRLDTPAPGVIVSPLVVPALAPKPDVDAPAAAVAVEPEPEPVDPGPAVEGSPRPPPAAGKRGTASKYTAAKVATRIKALQRLAEKTFANDPAVAEHVGKELDSIWVDLEAKKATPDELWRDLDTLEAAQFKK